LRILCANCATAQFALRIIATFFRVVQFALRIYKAIRFRNLLFKKVTAQIAQTDYLRKCCSSAFVKVIVIKENVKKNHN